MKLAVTLLASWVALSFVLGPIVGWWLKRKTAEIRLRDKWLRYQWYRESEAVRQLAHARTPSSGRTPPTA